VKVFSAKLGGVVFFGTAKASNLRKFSPLKVSRYTVVIVLHNYLFPSIRMHVYIVARHQVKLSLGQKWRQCETTPLFIAMDY